ncbi:MAG: 4Fe-4S binding protein [Muribaculaceae bacterium]|nr:4Fe-4S binding protein [Muribaculaceae bacterium]
MKLRKIRVALAVVFFTLITWLLLDFTGTAHQWLGWMAKIQFMPAVLALNGVVIAILVLLTLVFGRIYCSVICPLGVLQDLISRLHTWRKKNRFTYSPALTWLRLTMLAVLVVALVAGLSTVVALLAPYSTYGRIAANLLQPIYLWANNGLAAIAEHYQSYAFYSREVWLRSLPTLIIAVVTFAVITVLAWRGGRTWCNTICPVGTVLGYLAKFSWLKIRFHNDKCKSCGMCSKNCKASCIDFKNHTVDYTRCVACGNCLDKCAFGALSYAGGHGGLKDSESNPNTPPSGKEGEDHEAKDDVDNTRRAFLVGGALLAADAALAQAGKKVDGGLAKIEDKVIPERCTPLTPPGSFSAMHMQQHCTACQLCVTHCPNDVLRPSSDPHTLMQPTMSYERGYCRPECTRCSEVCPTGAIRPIDVAQRAATQVGHAVWVKENCVVLRDGVSCGNCARHCPAGAIMMVPVDPNDDASPMVPAVDSAKCIGCGACEYLCPARPHTAIYVEGHEMHKEI